MRRLTSILMATALMITPVPLFAQTTPTLTVTGTGTIEAAPDMATLSLGVTTTGATAGAAMAANTEALTAVMARLKTSGVEDRDIQTSNLQLNPNWVTNSSGTASEIQGYTAVNMVTVRIRALEQTGTVLDAAITDGANSLNGLTFGLQDPRPKQDEATKAAVADAIARATLIAEAAGAKLGPILSITEGGMADPMPGPMFRMAAEAVPVAAGSVDISASVTMVFQIGE